MKNEAKGRLNIIAICSASPGSHLSGQNRYLTRKVWVKHGRYWPSVTPGDRSLAGMGKLERLSLLNKGVLPLAFCAPGSLGAFRGLGSCIPPVVHSHMDPTHHGLLDCNEPDANVDPIPAWNRHSAHWLCF